MAHLDGGEEVMLAALGSVGQALALLHDEARRKRVAEGVGGRAGEVVVELEDGRHELRELRREVQLLLVVVSAAVGEELDRVLAVALRRQHKLNHSLACTRRLCGEHSADRVSHHGPRLPQNIPNPQKHRATSSDSACAQAVTARTLLGGGVLRRVRVGI